MANSIPELYSLNDLDELKMGVKEEIIGLIKGTEGCNVWGFNDAMDKVKGILDKLEVGLDEVSYSGDFSDVNTLSEWIGEVNRNYQFADQLDM